MIKRYYLDSGLDPCPSCVFTEDADGEWVKWEDVEAEVSGAMLWLSTVLQYSNEVRSAAYNLQEHLIELSGEE